VEAAAEGDREALKAMEEVRARRAEARRAKRAQIEAQIGVMEQQAAQRREAELAVRRAKARKAKDAQLLRSVDAAKSVAAHEVAGAERHAEQRRVAWGSIGVAVALNHSRSLEAVPTPKQLRQMHDAATVATRAEGLAGDHPTPLPAPHLPATRLPASLPWMAPPLPGVSPAAGDRLGYSRADGVGWTGGGGGGGDGDAAPYEAYATLNSTSRRGSWWGGVARSHSSPQLQPPITPLAASMPPWLTNPMSANAPVLSLSHSHFHSLAQAHSLLQTQSLSYSLARGPPCNPPKHLRHHKLMPLPPTDASQRLSTSRHQLDRLDLASSTVGSVLPMTLPMSSSSGSLPRLRPAHSLAGISP